MRIRNLIRDFFTKITGKNEQRSTVAVVKEPEDTLLKVLNDCRSVRTSGLEVVGQNAMEIYLADTVPHSYPGYLCRPNFRFAVRRNYVFRYHAVAPFWFSILHEQENLPALQGILSKMPPVVEYVEISLSFGDFETLEDGTEVFRFCSPVTARHILLCYYAPIDNFPRKTDATAVDRWMEQEKPDNWLRTTWSNYGENFYFYFRFDELLHKDEAELLALRMQFQKEIGEIGGFEVLNLEPVYYCQL